MSAGALNHGPDASAWQRALAKYQGAELSRSLWQLCSALLPYLCLLYLSYRSLAHGAWLTAPLLLLAGGFLVRTFVIFHDCAHGSFFTSRRANELAGTVLGVLLFTPFHEWRRRHSIHHAGSSDLDRRGWWDIETLTVREYLSLSPWGRLRYRLYRHPLVLFGLGPLAFFLFIQRLPAPGARRRQLLSVLWTNAGIVLTAALLSWLIGFRTYLLVQLPVLWLAATAGMWLFYVQHQFAGGYWARHGEWDYLSAALRGSSYYRLPRPLQWFTANIGFHHIHHLSTRIPNYNLERCHAENPRLQEVNTLTLLSGFRALSVRLWDEDAATMIGFGSLKAHDPSPEIRSSGKAVV